MIDGKELTEDPIIANGRISLIVDAKTGLMKKVVLQDGREISLSQNFMWYQAEDRYRGEKPSG